MIDGHGLGGRGGGQTHRSAPTLAGGRPLSPEAAAAVAGIFRALSDPTRVRMVSALADGEVSVGELAEALDMTLSAVSHQLSLLRRLRVVRARRDGRHVYYCLDDEHVLSLYRRALEHASHGTPGLSVMPDSSGCGYGNQH